MNTMLASNNTVYISKTR